ncbi:hypothetical protein JOF53_000916 [Crossiella equi]|uniref:Uncharacterized protein n=1 Tax=Crossiella equi TaxID=130796 RepID=A0ABS5A747_9PSEU|nr:hypothetical protein [Crossiella equi]
MWLVVVVPAVLLVGPLLLERLERRVIGRGQRR